MEMFEALDKVAPGANSRHTLLYGVEVKFYSSRIELSNQLETKIPNFFAIGDGAGITRGLAQASAAGGGSRNLRPHWENEGRNLTNDTKVYTSGHGKDLERKK